MQLNHLISSQLTSMSKTLRHADSSSMSYRRASRVVSLLIFLLTLILFVVSTVKTSSDSRYSIHTAQSFLNGHWGDLSEYLPLIEKDQHYSIEFRDNKPRSTYPIGASLTALPIVAAVDAISPGWEAKLKKHAPVQKAEKIIASIIGALAAVIFFWVIFKSFNSVNTALIATATFAFSTSMWSTATRALWQHGPLVLMLSITMLLLIQARKKPYLIAFAALPLAMAFVIRPTAFVPILIISTYILIYYRRYFLRYCLMAMLIAIPWLYFNISIYHWFLPPYYTSNAFSGNTDFMAGLLGNLFSPSRGLFVYSPVLLFSISGFFIALKDTDKRPLNLAFGLIIVGHMVIVANANMWWAGHSFGPRFTTDIIPFLVYFVSCHLYAVSAANTIFKKTVFVSICGLALVSAIIHAQGAISYKPYMWNVDPVNIDSDPDRAWDWRDPQFLRALIAQPNHNQQDLAQPNHANK